MPVRRITMSNDKFYKSEQGSKAAWKGFSSQTVYIANRLLFLEDDSDFFPENAEDLMLQKNGLVTELVQVKNLSADLALSHLSPQEDDSFFKRCLFHRSNNESLAIKVVSFGSIGAELSGLVNGLESSKKNVKKKLLQYGFSEDDTAWIFTHMKIEHVVEEELVSAIHEKLGSLIETMAAPDIILDVLTNYISNLSRTGEGTSKEKWEKKTQSIGIELASLSGVARQYGNTIFPIYEYKQQTSHEELRNEYLAGVNALPQHIKAGLDVPRVFWIDKIKDAFQEKKIVVVRGSSGQGKSSLAYRFLMDNYLECDIICIEKVTSEQQAVDIRSALSGVTKNRANPIIAYVDVAPYDTNWLWLCEKLEAQSNVQLLITIREEDFRRSPVDYSKHFFEEIELTFSKEEASELFQRYHSHEFLSFNDAWTSFGEAGPLMEFTYMLSQAESLKSRLTSQINQITQKELDADEWLHALTIISYAGKYSIPVDLVKLFSIIKCKQKRKMLAVFEKEYLLRFSNDGRYVECLHAVRASLLYDILSDDALFPEVEVLISAINTINDNALMMVVSYVYDHGINISIIEKLASISYDSWALYAGVLKALLWAEIYDFYQKNRTVIQKGDALTNGSFTMICIGDVTGYFDQINMDFLWEIVEKNNPGALTNAQQVLNELTSRIISYHYLDIFIQKTIEKLPLNKTLDNSELTPAGYCLFWLARRGYLIAEEKCNLVITVLDNAELLDSYLNYLVGIQEQKWDLCYIHISQQLKTQIQIKYNLILLKESEDEISAVSIIDIFDESGKQQFGNNYIMGVIESIRRYSSRKRKYNVEIIGHEIIEGITIPDMQKHIPAENLPWIWITQLNGWLNNLVEYDHMPPTWDECLQNINDTRAQIMLAISSLIQGLESLYKKGNVQKLVDMEQVAIIQKTYEKVNDKYSYFPQSGVDKYGINLSNSIVQDQKTSFELAQKEERKNKAFNRAFRQYCLSISNFIAQRTVLISERFKNEPVSHNGRLSLINLISALDTLPSVQNLYEKELSLKAPNFNCDMEYQQLLLLAAVWTYLFNNPLRIEKSVLYYRKEYLKNYRKRIKKFFASEISEYENIIEVKISEKIIEVLVESESVDDICLKIFENMKIMFPEVATLTLEGFLWEEYFDELQIKMFFWGELLPGGYVIPSKYFKTYSESDKFMKFRYPIENIDIKLEHNSKNAALKCFANLQPLYLLAHHTAKVNSKIQQLESEDINNGIYNIWCNNGESLIKDVFQEISNNLKFIFDELNEKEKMAPVFEALIQTIEELQTNASLFMKTDKSEVATSFYDSMSDSIIKFLDTLPQENFIEENRSPI